MKENNSEKSINELTESLSPNERTILPLLKEKNLDKLAEKTGLNKAAVLRSLEFLGNKGILELKMSEKKIVELGVNGLLYKKKGLPERRLISIIRERKAISLEDAKKASELNDNEFKAALGAIKKKALVNLVNGKLMFSGKSGEISKKTLEEQLLDSLPLDFDSLAAEQKFAVDSLKNRKNIIEINTKNEIDFKLTEIGKNLLTADLSASSDMIETLTPDLIKSNAWKGKKFRRYDLQSAVPRIYGGKRHFVNQATDYARKIWTELGFKEMNSGMCQTSFWVFDALFTAQDHPVRDIQDTFFVNLPEGKLPEKNIVNNVKKTHEEGISGSKGWRYKWDENEAKKVVLRTHTTCLSAKTLAKLRNSKDKNGKFFAIGSAFRNETIDASHLFEFNQTEGIVIDKNANFKNLLGYLKIFLNKMGFEKIRFRPHFFPYTEPSVEADVYNEKTGKWVEILGAGIFRPEVVIPLFGEWVPVLAWGMGFDRLAMENYKIKDIRELYENNLNKLREIKFWKEKTSK